MRFHEFRGRRPENKQAYELLCPNLVAYNAIKLV